jgi:hypothetical protein
MRKDSLLTAAAALTALAINISAQDISFENLSSGMAAITAGAGTAAVPDPVPSPVADPAESPAAQREWLVLIFMNGVNDLGILNHATQSINAMEEAEFSDKVAVLTEFNMIGAEASTRNIKFQRGSKTLLIRKDTDIHSPASHTINSPVIYSSNDTDMGSPAHLVRFIKRGIRQFPAKKVAVIIWNHGYGLDGISKDDASGNDMQIDQLGLAMLQAKRALGRKVDVFATDACYMQMAEVAYELKDSASVIVGSEEAIPSNSYPYRAIFTRLAADPGMSDEALGRIMVDAYSVDYLFGGATLSALRTSAMPGFLRLLNNWVQAASSDPKAFKAASSKLLVDETYHFKFKDSKDLHDYISRVNNLLPAGSAAVAAGSALNNYVAEDLIICDTAFPGSPKTHGLAIYIPDLRYNSANYEKLAFSADSLWDDFLKLMMEERLKMP